MEIVKVTKAERRALEAMRADPALRVAFKAMVEAARSGELAGKSPKALAKASAALPEPKKASTVSIAEMKEALRAADCLYDNTTIWKQLRATKVPPIPDAVIREAYEKGGRVILRCSSISEKTEALRKANRSMSFYGSADACVGFWGSAEQSDYQKRVSKPKWIVVPSHIDESTLGSSKSKVVTSTMPAPTPEDWFSVSAYAKLDGGRQPEGCESLYAFTTETGTVVGSCGNSIDVDRHDANDHGGINNYGAACFGPPRN